MSAALDLQQLERRSAPRYEAWKRGIISTTGAVSLACMIENVSESGALLELSAAAALPVRFTLIVPDDDVILNCQVVRKSGRFVGVEFVDGSDCSSDVDDE